MATSGLRERSALAARVDKLLNGVLDQDPLSTGELVRPLNNYSTVPGAVGSLLGRASAEAALGSPLTVRTDAAGTDISTFDAFVPATVTGPRGEVRLNVSLSRESRDGEWKADPLSFPAINVAPAGTGTPESVLINGESVPYPQGGQDLVVSIWPTPDLQLSIPGRGPVSWGASDLGRVPNTSLDSANGSPVLLRWAPMPSLTSEGTKHLQEAATAWVQTSIRQLVAHPNSSARKDLLTIPVLPPQAVDSNTNPLEFRQLKGTLIAQPRVDIDPASISLSAPQDGSIAVRLSGGRIRIDGEWKDGGTWRSFTSYRDVSTQGFFAPDFTTFVTAW